MDQQGYRKIQKKGEITLPKKYRKQNNLEKGDKIHWKQHSRDKTKLIIKAPE